MARRPTARADADVAGRILEAALAEAEAVGWNAVRLVEVAARLRLPMAAVLRHYRDKDALADAWLRRGWEAMLAERPAGFGFEPADRRVEACLLDFFDALAPHRRVTAEMLRGKLQPGHPHHWVPLVFNLSRTVHWLREAAQLPAVYGSPRAQLEEVGLSALLVATTAVWAGDDSEGQQRTRRFLRRRLAQADRLLARLGPSRRSPGRSAPEARGGSARSTTA